jgi:hypothetical protein
MAVNYCGKKIIILGPGGRNWQLINPNLPNPGRDRKVDQSIKNKITNYEN